jgi:ATP-binding cassette subfamily B protein
MRGSPALSPLSAATAGSRGSEWRAFGRLLPYLWPAGQPVLRARVVAALLLMVAAKAATISVPLLYKEAVDSLEGAGRHAGWAAVPVAILAIYGGARVLASLFTELRDFAFVAVGQRAIRAAGLEVFRHLHRLSLAFHLDRRAGGLARSIERGTRGVEYLLNFMLFSILPTIVEITLTAVVLARLYDGVFAAATVATIVAYIVYTLAVTEWRTKFRRAMNECDSEAAARSMDSLNNFESVKHFGNEEHEARRLDHALARFERAATISKTTMSLLNIGQGLIIATGLMAVTLLAGKGYVEGTMTMGDFVLVNAYIIQLYLPLNFLGFVYREVKHALADIESMLGLLACRPEVEDRPGARPLLLAGGAVRFEGVRFGYDAARPILGGVDLHIPAGRTVAVVGPSGGGKSTLSRLLMRFYDVDGGRVLVDGQDIRGVTQDSLRAAIGIVPQDTVLFNDTIGYNIAYGRPGATRAEIEEAARLARIHDFIASLPLGYDTRVGERGLKLSGGEKQRVAIARTVLKRPSIWIFDEATSALDSHTEREIQDSLREASKDRTTLIVAHRLSTVVDADEILVLDEGRIVERGGHAGLLAAGGRYAALWRRQHSPLSDSQSEPVPEHVQRGA